MSFKIIEISDDLKSKSNHDFWFQNKNRARLCISVAGIAQRGKWELSPTRSNSRGSWVMHVKHVQLSYMGKFGRYR